MCQFNTAASHPAGCGFLVNVSMCQYRLMYAFTITASCPAVCLGAGNSVWLCAHTAHFCLKVDSSFLLYSVKDGGGGGVGGKE